MTRLLDASYEQINKLVKALAAAGMTLEEAEHLIQDRRRTQKWVEKLQDRNSHVSAAAQIPVTEAFHMVPEQVRVKNVLLRHGFTTLGEVSEKRKSSLLDIKGIGIGTVRQIQLVLEAHDLALRP